MSVERETPPGWDDPLTPERAAHIRSRILSGESHPPAEFDRGELIAWLDRIIAGEPEPESIDLTTEGESDAIPG